jgi:methylmalonyl-CoA/ethylmalonyl-CoA epimerase
MPPIQINHVAIVVPDVTEALKFWHKALGLNVENIERNDTEAVEIAVLPLAGGEIELISPTSEDSGVAKYLAKHGPGLHHICMEVDSMDASIAQLTAEGAQLIDQPKSHPDGTRYAFIHPRSTGGVLLELYELPKK